MQHTHLFLGITENSIMLFLYIVQAIILLPMCHMYGEVPL